MKLQIAYELTTLSEALAIAKDTANFADIIEVGTLLIYKEGIRAIEAFRKEFPEKEILADAKISDRGETATKIFAESKANYITVLAGTRQQTIQKAATSAHAFKAKLALDLLDAYSKGQSAMDAKQLGVDILIFQRLFDDGAIPSFQEEWDNIIGNTDLPILIGGNINRSNIKKIIDLKPYGIIIGSAIINAENPAEEAQFFKELL